MKTEAVTEIDKVGPAPTAGPTSAKTDLGVDFLGLRRRIGTIWKPPHDPREAIGALLVVVLALVLFALACALPSAVGPHPLLPAGTTYYGYQAFLGGWAVRGLCIGWLANPLFVVACLYLLRGRSGTTAFIAGLGLQFGLLPQLVVMHSGTASSSQAISGLLLGYYLWLASFLTLFVGSLALAFTRARKKTVAPEAPR